MKLASKDKQWIQIDVLEHVQVIKTINETTLM